MAEEENSIYSHGGAGCGGEQQGGGGDGGGEEQVEVGECVGQGKVIALKTTRMN